MSSEKERPGMAQRTNAQAAVARRTETGGRISWTWVFCTSIPPCPIRWARSSTTPRNSRASTWRP